MMAMLDTATTHQIELLECLDGITTLQAQALDLGDLLALDGLSAQRAAAVAAAAPFVPPAMPWSPQVEDLAMQVKSRSEELQQSIRGCMAAVRKELLALNERQQVAGYLKNEMAHRGVQWQR